MEKHRIIIAILLSILAWKLCCLWLIEMSFLKFISIEFLIAYLQFFGKFAMDKAEGKPTIFEDINNNVK